MTDNATKIAIALIGLFGSIIVAMMQRLTTKVDGRLTELLKLTEKSSHAEGMKDQLSDTDKGALND
jgi:hypothetical protein